MLHKCSLVLLLLLFSIPFKSYSSFTIRPYSEIGIFGGTSYYLGELNHVHFPMKLLQPAGGLFYRYNLNGHYALRSFINYSEVKGYDVYSNNVFEKNRGLSFASKILEVGSILEFNFYEFALYKDAKRKITPFIFGGLNYFYFNPQGNIGGSWVDLQPLGTEGQGTSAFPNRHKYSLHQIGMPMGIGVKVKIQRFAITAEWGIRKTFTDYIDDVSTTYVNPNLLSGEAAQLANRGTVPSATLTDKQRGNSKTSDWYVFTGITISFKLAKEAPCRDNN
ncbi:MAG: DUF6089 family protein [Bacteroidetes bacterium]|nr:DUF6089 family protein [Bacteroidota bacterium]